MAKSKKKDFTLLLIAFFCSSLAHAQKQVPAERKDSIDNGSNIIKIVGNHSNKGAVNNALDVLSGQAAGVNVTSNGLDRMAMLNSVRVRGTTSIIGGNEFPTPRLPVVFPYYSYNSYLPPYCFYFKILAIDAIIVANDALVVAMDKVFCKDQLLFSFTGTITSQPGWISSRLPFFALFT